MMIRSLLSVVALSVSMGLSAADVDQQSTEHFDPAVVASKAHKNFGQHSPAIAETPLKSETALAEAFNKNTGLSFGVMDHGGWLLVDSSSRSLLRPSASFFIADGTIKSGAHILLQAAVETEYKNIFPSSGLPDGVVKAGDLYKFTDPTCGYCREVDKELEDYMRSGIELHYIPFPRQGLTPNNPGYLQWVAAACHSDPADAYHQIIMGRSYSDYKMPDDFNAECTKVIQQGFDLGRSAGVEGTPNMLMVNVNGESSLIPGFRPAVDVARSVGLNIKPKVQAKQNKALDSE